MTIVVEVEAGVESGVRGRGVAKRVILRSLATLGDCEVVVVKTRQRGGAGIVVKFVEQDDIGFDDLDDFSNLPGLNESRSAELRSETTSRGKRQRGVIGGDTDLLSGPEVAREEQ